MAGSAKATLLLLVSAVLTVLVAGPGRADFEAGMRAANLRDYAGAYREWRAAAEQGDPRAQYFLGELYEEGRGVGRDAAAAARWYRRAADQGHAAAQNALAILYVEGRGVGRDDEEAYKWFALAAGAGNGFAGRNLERLASRLAPERIAAAERRVRQWQRENAAR